MKRTALKRGKRLAANPEKVREFLRRGHENATLNRSRGLGNAAPPQRHPRAADAPVGPLTPGEWRVAVLVADNGHCVGCGAGPFTADQDRWVWQAHHPLPKRMLPPELKYDPRNGVVLCRRCHEQHEAAFKRVPGDRLPGRVWAFASDVGAWASIAVQRAHPLPQEEQ